MRVVAGRLRGRRIAAPKGEATRPTSDRVREALFSSLCAVAPAVFAGGAALDAFAGSGALGIEALSRGCAAVTFVEHERAALECLRNNLAALDLTSASRVLVGDSFALARCGAVVGGPFALLLLDPPYRLDASESVRLVHNIAARELLEPEAVVVFEHAAGVVVGWPDGVRLIGRKRYGSTEIDIAVYERGAGPT